MIENTLIKLLKSFSPEEIKRFRNFLKSPYFNSNKNVILLFDKIVKIYPSIYKPNFTNDKFKKKINKYGFYNENTLRYLLWCLQKLIDRFLIEENLYNDKLYSADFLLFQYNLRNIGKLTESKLKYLDKEFDENENVNINTKYFFYRFLINTNKINYHILNKTNLGNKKFAEKNFNETGLNILYLFLYFITETISEFINIYTYKFEYDFALEKNFISAIFRELNLENIKKEVKLNSEYSYLLDIYISLLNVFQHIEDDSFYYKYKKIFLDNINKLDFDEKSSHFTNLVNILILKRFNNLGTTDLLNEEFRLYQIILDNEYYKEGKINHLPLSLFRTILFTSLKLRKFNWCKDFIDKYHKIIAERDRQNMYNYGLAFYYYEKEEINKASNHIFKITIDNFIYKYDLRNLTLKIYYEIEDTEAIMNLIHNYKDFIRYNASVSKERKNVFGNFIGFVEKLVLSRTGKEKIDLRYLKRQVKENKSVSNREWLMDKIEELLSKKAGLGVTRKAEFGT